MNPNPDFAAALAATGVPWVGSISVASLPGTDVRITRTRRGDWVAHLHLRDHLDPDMLGSAAGRAATAPEALATLAARLEAIRADIDAALTALAPALPPKPAPRPVCPLCETDADAPTVERLMLVPHTVHAVCSTICHHNPEPGDAVDRLPDFVEAHLPDAPAGSLRHADALAALSRDYPGILTINTALKAAQPTK